MVHLEVPLVKLVLIRHHVITYNKAPSPKSMLRTLFLLIMIVSEFKVVNKLKILTKLKNKHQQSS